MKITIERDALHSALAYVGSARRNKTTMPILEHVRLSVDAEGPVVLTCSDLDVWCTEDVGDSATQREPGAILLNYAQLHDAVQGAPEGSQVEIRYDNEAPTASLAAGRTSFKLRVLTDGDFPLAQHVDATEWTVSAPDLRDAVKLAQGDMFKGLKGAFRPHMQGEFLHVRDEQLRIAAMDGFQMVDIPLGSADGVVLPKDANGRDGIIVPDTTIPPLLSILGNWEGAVTLRVTDRLFRVDCNKRTLVSKLIDARFLSYEHMMRPHPDNHYKIRSDVLAAALRRAGVVLDSLHPIVSFFPGNGAIELKAQGEGGDAYQDVIEAEVGGTPAVFRAKQSQLLAWLDRVRSEELELHIPSDPNTPLKIVSCERRDMEKLMMGMKG